jgi:hypothetical protein
MSSHEEVERVYLISEDSLKRARAAYAESFGLRVNDKSIDGKIAQLLKDAIINSDDTVAIAAQLVLAIVLRPGWRSHSRPRKGKWPRRAEKLAISRARKRKAELVATGVAPGKAGEQAAREARESADALRHLSIATIRDRMSRSDK